MTGNQLYNLICRFPQEILPGGLRAVFARILWDMESQWVGEFWFSAPETLLPHLYMKLHLPQGEVMRLQNRAPGKYFAAEGQPRPKPDQKLMEYLHLCAQYMEVDVPDETVQKEVIDIWLDYFNLSDEMKIWWSSRPECAPIAAPTATIPPRWLLEYWTVDHLAARKNSVLDTDDLSDEEFFLLKFGCQCTAKLCVPGQLTAGLPRFSYDSELGWTVEYLYFYWHEFKSHYPFDPQYRLKLTWPTGVLIEAENLSNTFKFEKRWGIIRLFDHERYYLKQCWMLLSAESPTQTQIDELHGLWLINHSWILQWLQDHKWLTEEMTRGALCPRWPQHWSLLLHLWGFEMIKGVQLGSPEVSKHCARQLAAATPLLHNEHDKLF